MSTPDRPDEAGDDAVPPDDAQVGDGAESPTPESPAVAPRDAPVETTKGAEAQPEPQLVVKSLANPANTPPATTVTKPNLTDVQQMREETALRLAQGTLWVLAASIIIPLGALSIAGEWEHMRTFAQTVVPALTTLLGVAFGFYFSEKRHH